MNKNKLIYLTVGLFCFTTMIVNACGPYFDNAYFVRMSENDFLAIPEGDFFFELRNITGDTSLLILSAGQAKRVEDIELRDLKSMLKAQKVKGEDVTEVLSYYKNIRNQITAFLDTTSNYDDLLWYGGSFRSIEKKKRELIESGKDTSGIVLPTLPLSFPTGTPKEFQLYLTGAVKYHSYDFEGAIKDWEEILTLPKSERKYKSTWANFMLGKAYLSQREQEKAIPYFIETRKLAEQGYSDSLDLAFDSYGWQALAEFESKDEISSIKHYLKQSDVDSLSWVCHKVSESQDSTIEKLVQDKTARTVLLGWVVSGAYWYDTEDKEYQDFVEHLVTAIQNLKKVSSIDYADRVAWIYYNRGEFDKAKQWVKLSKLSTPLSKYIDFKLTLRDGKIDDAMKKLAKIIPTFEQSKDTDMFFQEDVRKILHSEMAVLKLSRKEYLSTFELTLQGKYWEDIAYMAEKVLTVQELENYLAANKNNSQLTTCQSQFGFYYPYNTKETLKEGLEYLLARRLARQGEWNKAIEFMPEKVASYNWYSDKTIKSKALLIELSDLMLKSQIIKNTNLERAQAYYEAGMIMRKYGMELVGTELDPDGYVNGGAYPYYDSLINRFGLMTKEMKSDYDGTWRDEEIKDSTNPNQKSKQIKSLLKGSKDEEKRVLASLPSPNKRFHYRYNAAELMWTGAQLLPDNDELKARLLCRGGSFIKTRDPKYANKFYKALVKTCPKTELGKEADKLKWFPELPNQ